MSDDDNQMTPDDGALDDDVVTRLKAALLDDVRVETTERDRAVRSVMAQLANDSPSNAVTELSSRRRNRIMSSLQVAAAVSAIAVGAGMFLQLQSGGDDSLELSLKQSTGERSEGDFSLAVEESADDASDSGAGAIPEAALAEESVASEDLMEYDEEMAVENEATADLALATADVPAVSVDDLPSLMTELVTERRSSLPINDVCALGDGERIELLAEVVVDGELISIVSGSATDSYLAVNLTTCAVLADVEIIEE